MGKCGEWGSRRGGDSVGIVRVCEGVREMIHSIHIIHFFFTYFCTCSTLGTSTASPPSETGVANAASSASTRGCPTIATGSRVSWESNYKHSPEYTAMFLYSLFYLAKLYCLHC